MPREHWNDVPGDIAGGSDEDLPGGFGLYNPDLNPDATIDELIDNDAVGVDGNIIAAQGQGGDTAGTGYVDARETGSTIDPNALVQGEEAHPGAGVGLTGAENDKRVPPPELRSSGQVNEAPPLGGTPDDTLTHQQQEAMSVETEGPTGGQGAAGTVRPPKKK